VPGGIGREGRITTIELLLVCEELVMPDRNGETRNPHSLTPHPNNAVRVHSTQQIRRLTESIKEFGFTRPVLIDENDVILAGHACTVAAKKLGLAEIPVRIMRGLTKAKKRAYVLFDNKSSEMAGTDRSALVVELQDLSALLASEGLDFELTGFSQAEFDALLVDLSDPEQVADEEVASVDAKPVSQQGDTWVLGDRHRILCGDARRADYDKLMRSDRAAMVFADPPYNVNIPKAVGRGRVKHRNFAMASGEMSFDQFKDFLIESLSPAVEFSADGALNYICMDWRHYGELLAAGKIIYNELLNVVVWCKTAGGQGSFYRSQHEEIFVFKSGSGPYLNNVQLGRLGRNRTNVWTYPGANSFRVGRLADLTAHPTVKPVALVMDAIRDCTRRGDVILDPFLGAGTTILAADRIGRRAYGIEIDPLYVDVAVRRWQAATKADAILEGSGKTFDEVAAGSERIRRRS
jgi:DNA modification methylase